MATINQIRTAIRTALLTKCSNVFYQRARKDIVGDYIIFDLDLLKGEVMTQINLDVHIIGSGQNTDSVETIADNVWDLFDHYYYMDSNMEFTSYQNTRSNRDDEDKLTIHRTLNFTLRLL